MRQLYHRQERTSRRVAFTLIEMLVSMAIIVVLVALSATAVFRFLGVQKQNNTMTTLNKVASRLHTTWSANRDKFWNEPIPDTYLSYIQQNLSGTGANSYNRARVIWVKLRYRQLFPLTFTEALNPSPLPPLPTYKQYLSALGITGSSGAAYESSACLYMALKQGQSGAGDSGEDLSGGGSVVAFALPSPSTRKIPAFVDGWGTPLVFCRWPTGSTVLNPNGAQAGTNDPDDPTGLLAVSSWLTSTSPNYAQNFQNLLHPLPTTAGTSYTLTPLVVSSGPDKVIGLIATTLAPATDGTAANADDDLYSNGT
jgi:prepilin-type N-terminal cleavage/methylation domain-containing protein